MGRADELRTQLAKAMVEEDALATYEDAKSVYRAHPDNPEAKAAMQAAARVVRETRAQLRADRVVTAGPGDAVIAPATVAARATVKEV